MRYDKNYHVTCAIYRMLKQKRIDKENAIRLLIERAKVKAHTAQGCVELWLEYPLNPKRAVFA